MNETINLLFCVSQRYLGLLVCSLKSIVLHGGYSHYDVYILHSFFDEGMMEAIRRDFSDSVTFHFIRVENEMTENLPIDGNHMPETYYRFLAPFLLPEEMERVLYLDADTLVINPLQELYEMPFDGNAVVGCTHTREFLAKVNQARQQSNKAVLHLNPGVLLMNLRYMREHIRLTDVLNSAHKQRTNLIPPDQFILTSLYGNQVKLADTMRFNLAEQVLRTFNTEHKHHPVNQEWIREHGVILHYCGFPKPGDKNFTGQLAPFYEELMDSATHKSTGSAVPRSCCLAI